MENNNQEKKVINKLNGVVVSDKMDKTVVVFVETVKVHPKYGKRFVRTSKYKAHDEKNQFKEGDKVTIIAARPMSKDKRWRVVYEKELNVKG